MIDADPIARNYGYDSYGPGTPVFRQAAASSIQTGDGYFGADGFGFSDLLDAINPLQHLPIVGTLYRSLTGDEISAGARIAGGTLFGGPIGFLVAIVDSAVDEATGRDLGGNMLAGLTGEEQAPAQAAAVPAPAVPTKPVPMEAVPAEAFPAAAPRLSPEAFETLLRSFGGGAALPPPAKAEEPDDRRAAMQLHEALRRYAETPRPASTGAGLLPVPSSGGE